MLLFLSLDLSAQEIKIAVKNKALNEVLIEIRDKYNLNISFDDKELSKYKLTVNKSFGTPEETFEFLLKDLPITFEKTASVYLFFANKSMSKISKTYLLSGKIYDIENSESLPFTNIIINGIGGISDEFGNFNFESKSDSVFQLHLSYLGYQIHDTTLSPGTDYRIGLSSSIMTMGEVEIVGNQIFFSKQIGSKPGLMRINHKIARFIPGNGDNSIFNILRLQPGILAAGEQSSEMIIWGSYQGQSQVNFDGITLFGLKNYNDNISTVNPFMAKDVRIHKGGFDATMGERVGGIVDITGIEGDRKKPRLNLMINNMTMNVLAELPLGNEASLVGAYRQTYYELYSPNDIKINQRQNTHLSDNNILVNPDYVFRDGNLKYSGQTKNGDSYHISTFWGQDHFSYVVDQTHFNSTIAQELDEKNRQFGARANYNKLWKGVGSSNITFSYSGLQSDNYRKDGNSEMSMNHSMQATEVINKNNISELKIMVTGNRLMSNKHEIEYGGGLIHNNTFLLEESNNISTININEKGSQFVSYIQDKYSPNKYFSLVFGLHNNYSSIVNKNYLQPRISLSINPNTQIRLNASWGIYNQFITHSTVVDENNNYRYQWRISDGQNIPVLSSQHFVFGGVYNYNGFTFSLEGFYKDTKGITRVLSNDSERLFYSGKSKAQGIDVFIKQEYKGHSIWVSYSLSKTLEWFPFFASPNYERAIHDQRHEVKIAGILNLSPFYLSANFVYGTGFPPNNISDKEYPYSRFDISGIYRFHIKHVKIETGLSILNLFNYENIKYANFVQIPTEGESTIGIYSESVPFTPTLFLNISL